MVAEYSTSPHGEKFRLPGPNDYIKEFECLKALEGESLRKNGGWVRLGEISNSIEFLLFGW